mmetsp:Transcript_6216/g.14430  ORF Transcript_6216/g.14430 Transcript_6216/m.14430 type:complete len:201 (+) Transcript_6216:223-825(+)
MPAQTLAATKSEEPKSRSAAANLSRHLINIDEDFLVILQHFPCDSVTLCLLEVLFLDCLPWPVVMLVLPHRWLRRGCRIVGPVHRHIAVLGRFLASTHGLCGHVDSTEDRREVPPVHPEESVWPYFRPEFGLHFRMAVPHVARIRPIPIPFFVVAPGIAKFQKREIVADFDDVSEAVCMTLNQTISTLLFDLAGRRDDAS